MVDEAHAPGDEAEETPIRSGPEHLAARMDMVVEIGAILVGRMQTRKPRHRGVEGNPVQKGDLVHILRSEPPEPKFTHHRAMIVGQRFRHGEAWRSGGNMREKSAHITAFLGAAICLAALALQLALMIMRFEERGGTALAGLWRFLGFFTNLTNIIAALVLARAALRAPRSVGPATARVEAAVAAAIVMAGFLNSLLLSARFHPQGLFWLADFALHFVTPGVFALFWVLRPHGGLRAMDAVYAMAWPLLYCVYALARGAADGWYPYYFLDPQVLGVAGVAASILGLGLAFFAAALILFGLDHLLGGAGKRVLRDGDLAVVALRAAAPAPVLIAFDEADRAKG